MRDSATIGNTPSLRCDERLSSGSAARFLEAIPVPYMYIYIYLSISLFYINLFVFPIGHSQLITQSRYRVAGACCSTTLQSYSSYAIHTRGSRRSTSLPVPTKGPIARAKNNKKSRNTHFGPISIFVVLPYFLSKNR